MPHGYAKTPYHISGNKIFNVLNMVIVFPFNIYERRPFLFAHFVQY